MTPDLTIQTKTTVGKRIAINTMMMVVAKILATLCGIGTFVIATRALDPALFGTVVFMHAYMLFFSEVATFKAWQSIIRFGSDDLKDDDSGRLAKLLNFGLRLDLLSVIGAYLASIALMGVVVAIVESFPGMAPQEGLDIHTIQKYAALYCLVVLFKVNDTVIGIFRLFDKFTVLALLAMVMPVIRLAGSVYAAWAGWSIEGFLMVWFIASAGQYILTLGLGLRELQRRGLLWPTLKAKYSFLRPRKGIWGFVFKSNVDSTIATGNMHLPLLLVMAIFGPAWAGIYKIAEEVAKLLTEAFKLLDQVIYPELAKMVIEGRTSKIWRITTRAAGILLSLGLLFSVLIFAFGRPVLVAIFGDSYEFATPLASLLVPAAALMGIAAPLFPVFYAADKPERAIYVRGAALVVYIGLFLGLSFTIGRMAPGWAALGGNLFVVLAVIIAAKATLKSTIKRQRLAEAQTWK